jgi:hypothetical protein
MLNNIKIKKVYCELLQNMIFIRSFGFDKNLIKELNFELFNYLFSVILIF